ncbi:MAG: AsmA family protein [Rhodospirillum sp.]|nr:AsmA family protein [Rhodospirillum sp.]MCF8488070.1 AsmA family protein [Rhodospirillum sp.]MCF8502199.1 AsmA family protein [Rhodospirillum sp.]
MTFGKILKIVGLLVVALIVGLVAAVMSLDVNSHKQALTAEISQMAGRELTISGDLGLSLGWNPALTAAGITFANADWAGKEPMFAADQLEARVALVPLLTGDLVIQKVLLDGARIQLATNKQGVGNWVLPTLNSSKSSTEEAVDRAEKTDGDPPRMDVRRIELTNILLTYKDGQSEDPPVSVELKRLALESHEADDNLSVQVEGKVMDQALTLAGQMGSLPTILSGGDVPISFHLAMADSDGRETMDGTIDGHLINPLNQLGLDLRFAAHAPDLSHLSEGALLSQRLDVTGHLAQDGEAWLLQDIALRIGQSAMNGSLRLDPTVEPVALTGSLDFPLLALIEFIPEPRKDADKAPGGATVIPDTPIDLTALRSLPLSIALPITAERVVLPSKLSLDKVALEIKAKPGVAGPITFSTQLANGVIDGQATVTVQEDGATGLVLNAKGKGVVVGDLLDLVGDGSSPLTGGATDLTLSLKGSGTSPHSIAASLNGQILISMGKGEVDSALVDLMGGDVVSQVSDLINPFGRSNRKTALRCVVVNTPVKDGVITWDRQVAVETDRMTVASVGTVALGTETLDVGVKPRPREGIGLEAGIGKVTQLFRVTGTFAKPEVDVDLGSAVVEAAGTATKLGAAVATLGGTVALEDMANSLLGVEETDTAPCETALGNKPPPKASTSTGTTTSTGGAVDAVKGLVDGVTGSEGSVGDAAKGAADAVKEGLGSLFGK